MGASESGAPTRVVSGGSGITTLVRAALPSVPGVNLLPGIRKGGEFGGLSLARPELTVERDHVDAYADVCGFPRRDTVPVTYPFVLAFPLHMALMSDRAFPTPAMGMVHLENSITRHRSLRIGERVAVSASVDPPLPHPAGSAYQFTTRVTADGEPVWESVSTYLKRGRRSPDVVWPSTFEEVAPSGPVFALGADLGRRYAAVAGDYNPIHLTPLTAKALGFPRHIAHGMWTKARSLAVIDNRLPERVRVDVAFRKPVFLPSSVAFGARRLDDGYAFSLTKRGNPDTVHLLGRTTAL